MTATYYWLHLAAMIAAVTGLACWSIISIRYNSIYIFIGSTLYLLNVIAFSSMRLFGVDIDPMQLNYWSLGIRLQGVITIAGAGLFLLLDWDRYHE